MFRTILTARSRPIAAALGGMILAAGCAPAPPRHFTWGITHYGGAAEALAKAAQFEMSKPLEQRAKDAGVTILDYASACLASGRIAEAQKAFYQGILLTNDITLSESAGEASLVWDEATKVWQGEAYERATAELLHGICLMRLGDFDNARVAFDRALVSDRYSKGALRGREGMPTVTHGFQPNDDYYARGGSVFQRDFLAAYVLRTLCFIHLKRPDRADKSWQETTKIYRELVAAAQGNDSVGQRVFWTGNSGRYQYPNVYLPPFQIFEATGGSPATMPEKLFGGSIDKLAQANLLVVVGSGSQPKKLKVGEAAGGDTNFIHDDYFPPSESVYRFSLMIDGKIVGPLTQCLNLYGQAAGRGPSIKDLAQDRKGDVEDFGRALEKSGINYLKLIGLVIRAVNQEEADIRQWTLLPNMIHIWIGRVEPAVHRLTLLPSGANMPSIEWYWPDRSLSSTLQTFEGNYLETVKARAKGADGMLALRHCLARDIGVQPQGLTTVFMGEQFNAAIEPVSAKVPKRYELLPRRQPGKS